jgi:hypothetical protein
MIFTNYWIDFQIPLRPLNVHFPLASCEKFEVCSVIFLGDGLALEQPDQAQLILCLQQAGQAVKGNLKPTEGKTNFVK